MWEGGMMGVSCRSHVGLSAPQIARRLHSGWLWISVLTALGAFPVKLNIHTYVGPNIASPFLVWRLIHGLDMNRSSSFVYNSEELKLLSSQHVD